MQSSIETLKAENKSLNKRLSVESEANQRKQIDLANNCIITSFPLRSEAMPAFGKICNAIGFDATNKVETCRILPSKITPENNSKQNTTSMLVRFNDVQGKKEFYAKKKAKGRLFTKAIGLSTTLDQLIINRDHLIPDKMMIMEHLRKNKEALGIEYLWVQNASVLIKITNDAKIHRINTQLDLDKFEAQQ